MVLNSCLRCLVSAPWSSSASSFPSTNREARCEGVMLSEIFRHPYLYHFDLNATTDLIWKLKAFSLPVQSLLYNSTMMRALAKEALGRSTWVHFSGTKWQSKGYLRIPPQRLISRRRSRRCCKYSLQDLHTPAVPIDYDRETCVSQRHQSSKYREMRRGIERR